VKVVEPPTSAKRRDDLPGSRPTTPRDGLPNPQPVEPPPPPAPVGPTCGSCVHSPTHRPPHWSCVAAHKKTSRCKESCELYRPASGRNTARWSPPHLLSIQARVLEVLEELQGPAKARQIARAAYPTVNVCETEGLVSSMLNVIVTQGRADRRLDGTYAARPQTQADTTASPAADDPPASPAGEAATERETGGGVVTTQAAQGAAEAAVGARAKEVLVGLLDIAGESCGTCAGWDGSDCSARPDGQGSPVTAESAPCERWAPCPAPDPWTEVLRDEPSLVPAPDSRVLCYPDDLEDDPALYDTIPPPGDDAPPRQDLPCASVAPALASVLPAVALDIDAEFERLQEAALALRGRVEAELEERRAEQQEAMRRAVELDARIAQLLLMLGEGAA